MSENTKTPRIRFKGFTDAWEQRKLCDIAEKVTEKNVNTNITETFTNSAEFGIVSQRDYFDHDISNFDNLSGYYVVQNDDFVYNPRISTTAPVGPINRNKLGRKGVMSPLYTVFRVKKNIDFTFLEWYFKSECWHGFMRFNGDSGARSDRFSIKDEIMFQMSLPYPDGYEQENIGELLSKFDNLITLHQRKCDKLKNIKAALLEKMFPQGDATTPKIRFKGFTDAWEQRKLGGEAEELLAGGDIDKDLICESGRYPVIANALTNDGIVGFYEKYYRVEAPAVTVTGRGDVGHAQARRVNFTPVVRLLSIKSRHNVDFLENAINRGEVIIESTGVPQLTVPQLSKRTISFPQTVQEEEKIGKLFFKIDNLITLHQRKVEKLKNIKSALLEKMFV